MLWATGPACRRGSAAGSEPFLVPRGISPPVAKEGAPACSQNGGWAGGRSEKEGQLRTPSREAPWLVSGLALWTQPQLRGPLCLISWGHTRWSVAAICSAQRPGVLGRDAGPGTRSEAGCVATCLCHVGRLWEVSRTPRCRLGGSWVPAEPVQEEAQPRAPSV